MVDGVAERGVYHSALHYQQHDNLSASAPCSLSPPSAVKGISRLFLAIAFSGRELSSSFSILNLLLLRPVAQVCLPSVARGTRRFTPCANPTRSSCSKTGGMGAVSCD